MRRTETRTVYTLAYFETCTQVGRYRRVGSSREGDKNFNNQFCLHKNKKNLTVYKDILTTYLFVHPILIKSSTDSLTSKTKY